MDNVIDTGIGDNQPGVMMTKQPCMTRGAAMASSCSTSADVFSSGVQSTIRLVTQRKKNVFVHGQL